MDKGNYTGLILLDLQKAFDTVNPQHNVHKNYVDWSKETLHVANSLSKSETIC